MSRNAAEDKGQRIVILAPTGRDGALATAALHRAGFSADAYEGVNDTCAAVEEGAGALLVAEEALTGPFVSCLAGILRAQPAWSDLPILVLSAAGATGVGAARMEQLLDVLGNVTVIERPVRVANLVTAVRAALRARNRQYAARGLLETLGRKEEETRERADFEQQLIGIVSHDLRNPLTAIKLGVSALLRSPSLGDRETRGLLRVQESAERATRMVKDLLDFTQARLGGGIRLERRQADLHAVTRAVVDEVEASHPGRHILLRQEGDARGVWDPDRLAQVVQNLVTNAVKYSPPESAVRVLTGTDGDWAELTVENEGEPIPAERLPEIFRPMTRATSEIDRAGRSVGLGLYIVRHIVDAHGGNVLVRSNEEGTVFLVQLPRSAGATSSAAASAG